MDQARPIVFLALALGEASSRDEEGQTEDSSSNSEWKSKGELAAWSHSSLLLSRGVGSAKIEPPREVAIRPIEGHTGRLAYFVR